MNNEILLTQQKEEKTSKTGGQSNEIIIHNRTNSIEREVIQ
jgi:hypothetical protein